MSASQFCKQLSLPAHRLHHSQATSAKRGQTPSSKHHLYPTAVLQHWEEVISPSQEQQPRDACLRAISSINTLQFETENSPRITVPSGYWHMQKVPAHSSWALWHGPPMSMETLFAEALCVQPPALHGALTSYLHWAGQGRCLSDKLCPGKWQKSATFILAICVPKTDNTP